MVLVRKPVALGTPPHRSSSPMEEGPRRSGGLKIKHARLLVVDDDPQLANGIARLARSMGHTAVTTDGMSALSEFKKGRFDLVITDLDMPVVSGIELLEQVLAISPDARVLIHTANESVSDSELIDLGAVGVLRKPAEGDIVKDTIRKNI